LSDGVKQGAFSCRRRQGLGARVFDATIRFHHPAHSEEWSDPGLAARIGRRAGAVAQGPGSATAQALNHLQIICPRGIGGAPRIAEALEPSRLTSIPPFSLIALPPARCCLISINSAQAWPIGLMSGGKLLLAIFADIHARGGIRACLDFARRVRERKCLPRRLRRYGGPIRNGRLRRLMGLVDSGAMAVRGNHDNAISNTESMNGPGPGRHRVDARQAQRGTAGFPGGPLPLTLHEEDRFYVHSEAQLPCEMALCRG